MVGKVIFLATSGDDANSKPAAKPATDAPASQDAPQ
jgi:hypothetical protein